MKEPPEKTNLKTYLLNAGFGMTIVFTTMTLFFWIFKEMPYPMAMVLVVSLANALLFMVFFPHVGRKTRGLYSGFMFSLTFTLGILVLWIFNEIVRIIPMSITIGVLVFFAFMMFSSAINRMDQQSR